MSNLTWVKIKRSASSLPGRPRLLERQRSLLDGQVGAHELAAQPPLRQSERSMPCPVFPRACPFGGACHACPAISPGQVPQEPICSTCSDDRDEARATELPPDVEGEDDEFAAELVSWGIGARATGTAGAESDDELPHADSATIVCDGKGGYRVYLGWAASATCGIRDCVQKHEESHIKDWESRWPNGCKKAGGTPKPDGAQVPTGGKGYDAFLRKSECTAYTNEIPCGEKLLKTAKPSCEQTIKDRIEVWKGRKKQYCT